MNKPKSIRTIQSVWEKMVFLLKRYPVIFAPFLIVALVDLFILFILFLAPRPPVSIVLAPIISVFWGEKFLHYPANFLLLPLLFNYAKNITSFIVGVTFTGIAAAMISQAYRNEKPDWWPAIKKAAKKYLRIAAIWGLTFASMIFAIKLSGYFNPDIHSVKLMFGIEFIINVAVQMAFVFAIPSIIIENRKIAMSIRRSLALLKKYFIAVFVFVFIPSLIFVPLTYVRLKLPLLMERIAPETVLYALSVNISALMIVDFIITSSAVVLLLMHRDYENEKQSV